MTDPMGDKFQLMNTKVDSLTMVQVVDIIDKKIRRRESLTIAVVNAAKLVNMQHDETLFEDVTSSNLILADGMAVVWASKILGPKLPERISGIDLMYRMMERGDRDGFRFYLFGASEAVSRDVESRIKESYPGAIIVGRRNGYFDENEEEDIAREIAASGADILLVAITSPIKERFMAHWRDSLNVPIIHGVGGSFDVMAGRVQRAPILFQKLGLEWLYRVLQEPRRLAWRYLKTNTLFIAYFLREVVNKGNVAG